MFGILTLNKIIGKKKLFLFFNICVYVFSCCTNSLQLVFCKVKFKSTLMSVIENDAYNGKKLYKMIADQIISIQK